MTWTDDPAAITQASGAGGSEARIDHAADAIGSTTRDMLDDLPARQPRLSQALRKMTVEAPLRSLALAFLLGVLIARRR